MPVDVEFVIKETLLEFPVIVSFVYIVGGRDVSDTEGSTTSRLKLLLASKITVVFVNSYSFVYVFVIIILVNNGSFVNVLSNAFFIFSFS